MTNPNELGPDFEVLWKFARGDVSEAAFEPWLYAAEADVEKLLGSEFTFDLISVDYSNTRAVADMRFLLKTKLTELYALDCMCLTCPDSFSIVLSLPENMPQLATLTELKDRTPWIDLRQCRICREYWLVSTDTVFDDVHFHRLVADEARLIVHENKWPVLFESNPNLWPNKDWLKLFGFKTLDDWLKSITKSKRND